MTSQLTLEESIQTLEAFLAKRAQAEGSAAFGAGVERSKIPAHLGVFSGHWVEGWLAAAAAAQDTERRNNFTAQPFTDEYKGLKIASIPRAAFSPQQVSI